MNKTVLVTGATGGIGEAICTEFAKNGYNIVIHYSSNEEKSKELKTKLKEKYKVNVCRMRADLCNPDEAQELGKNAVYIMGSVDVLVNNAGLAYQNLFQLSDRKSATDLFGVNVMGAMELTKAVLPSMINNKWGRIINISSMWGVSGASCEVYYSASKSALTGFTKALAKEVGPSGITVNCVAPGFIDTKMNSHLDEASVKEIIDNTPVPRAGKGEDVAYLCEFLASDKAEFITGQIISVDGGYI